MGQKALSRGGRSWEKVQLRKLKFDPYPRETDDSYSEDDYDPSKLRERSLAMFRRQRLGHLASEMSEWSEDAG